MTLRTITRWWHRLPETEAVILGILALLLAAVLAR